MTDLRIGAKEFDCPAVVPMPLVARGVGWLTYPLGALVSAAATVGLPAALLFALFGFSVSTLAMGASGGFLFLCLMGAVTFCLGDRRTGSNLFAVVFGLGHSLLLVGLALAQFVPGGKAVAASVLSQLPLLSAFNLASGAVGAAAILYLTAFVGFSVLAPVSLGMFRLLALSRPGVEARR